MIYIYILVMAVTTYLIRMIPFVFFKKKITNKRVLAFLHFVPYSCLTVMTVPAIFYSTGSVISAVIGLAVAVVLGLLNKPLPLVALAACGAVFIAELLI